MNNYSFLQIGLPQHFSGAIVVGVISKVNPSVFDLFSHQFTQYLTPDETARQLQVDIRTIRKWARKGKLHPYRYGHRVFYKRHELLNVMNQ